MSGCANDVDGKTVATGGDVIIVGTAPINVTFCDLNAKSADIPVITHTMVTETNTEELDGYGSDLETGALNEGKSDNELENKSDVDVDLDLQNTDFQIPTDDIRSAIVQQIEFYFSDANILKDNFLLKHVKRNKQGFVSLKLITSFRRVKKLTKDYRVVAYCLKSSEKLELNAEDTKVRRKDPLPEYDETVASRTVIVVNLPFEDPTVENVAELFAKCGDIAFVRILRVGKNIPQDVKKYMNKHPELGKVTCAVVEFDQPAAARKAEECMTNTGDWRHGMRVSILAPLKKEKGGGDFKSDKKPGDCDSSDKLTENGDAKNKSNTKQRRKNNFRVEELSRDDDSFQSSGSEMENTESGKSSTNKLSLSPGQISKNTSVLSPKTTPKSSPKGSPMNNRRGQHSSHSRSLLANESSPEMHRRNSGDGNLNPWIQRRLKAQQETSPLAGNSPVASPKVGRKCNDGSAVPVPKMLDMDGVIRQPKGPDGTRGFSFGRGRSIADITIESS